MLQDCQEYAWVPEGVLRTIPDPVGFSLSQCAAIGDLHHAIEQGLMKAGDVHAELGDVITGQAAGRLNDTEIIVFDSTGSALLDVAAAAAVYRKALQTGRGTVVNLGK